MKLVRRKRCWLLFAVTALLIAAYFEPTYCVRGWLWNEASFEGRPTSYWRAVIERDLGADPRSFHDPSFYAPATWLDLVKDKVGYRPRYQSSCTLVRHTESDAVLRQLTEDSNENIRGFATEILEKVHPYEELTGDFDDRYLTWIELLHKHSFASPT
jgi:hypothetical protein